MLTISKSVAKLVEACSNSTAYWRQDLKSRTGESQLDARLRRVLALTVATAERPIAREAGTRFCTWRRDGTPLLSASGLPRRGKTGTPIVSKPGFLREIRERRSFCLAQLDRRRSSNAGVGKTDLMLCLRRSPGSQKNLAKSSRVPVKYGRRPELQRAHARHGYALGPRPRSRTSLPIR